MPAPPDRPARPPCPICSRPRDPARREHAPFCSARCQLIDLGKWLGGDYAVPTDEHAAVPGDSDDEP